MLGRSTFRKYIVIRLIQCWQKGVSSLKDSIVILSMTLSNHEDRPEEWDFSALRVIEGEKPKYFLFSIDVGKGLRTPSEHYQQEIIDFLGDSTVLVGDSKTIILTNKLLGDILNPKDILDITELLLIFYPTSCKLGPEDIGHKLGLKPKHKFFSPAHKNTRFYWGLLSKCYQKGISLDIGLISQLQEFTKGLAIEAVFQYLIKQITKYYPDRPIRTGGYAQALDRLPPLLDAEPKHGELPLSSDWVLRCFQSGGLLSQHLPGYEDRRIQVKMAKTILDGFEESTNTLIEAGTGTGKSIAYLIPALWWAINNKTRIIVATHTITLQEQLFYKDLPFLHKVLPFTFKTSLLKGKGNYICLHRFYHEQISGEQLTKSEQIGLAGMCFWIRESLTGDFGELPYTKEFNWIWKRYGADNPYCKPNDCRYAKQCFMLRARKKAEEADLVVINHSLLLADIKTNHKTLPDYTDLVIDEAHNLYQTAFKQLGFELSFEHISRLLGNIYQGRSSLVYTLRKSQDIWALAYPTVDWSEFIHALDKIPEYGESIMVQANELFSLCANILSRRLNLRLDKTKIGKDGYSAFLVCVENLMIRFKMLVLTFDRLNSYLPSDNSQFERAKFDIGLVKNDLTQIIGGLTTISQDEGESRVTYLERSHVIYLKSTLIDIASILKEKIFNEKNSTVLTSATLSVADTFSYFARDVGLDDYKSIKLASPFDYNEQMLFCVVNDHPFDDRSEYSSAIDTASFIKQIAEVMTGRTLVLFTSHRYLRLVRDELESNLSGTDLQVLAQGIDGSREELLHTFMQDNHQILLGTSSFWEGVDIPGDALKCVIMVRLPFWPPDSPILEAKAKLLESRGLDAFNELHLPEAIIRFKQGFGRLIRTREDKGVVILLDDRILKRYYGKAFLKSLPILSYYRGNSDKVINQVLKWV